MRDLNRRMSLSLRLNEVEYEAFSREAERQGLKPATWMRQTLARAAKAAGGIDERLAAIESRIGQLEAK